MALELASFERYKLIHTKYILTTIQNLLIRKGAKENYKTFSYLLQSAVFKQFRRR